MKGRMVETEHVADFIEEFCLLTSRTGRHINAGVDVMNDRVLNSGIEGTRM